MMTKRDAAEGHERSSAMEALTKAHTWQRESEDEFRRILSEIPMSLSIISPEGEVLLINKKTIEIFDGEDEDLSSFNVLDIWSDPEQRTEWLIELSARGIVSDYEIEVVTFSGEHKTLQLSGLMITFEGRPCILSVHQDVTAKKKAEADLRISREKYRSLVENMNEILFVVDTTGVITYLTPNISSIIGYSVSELIGRQYTEFVHPDDRAERLNELDHLLSGKERSSEYRILKKGGGCIWVQTTGRPVTEDGQVTGLQGVLTDISSLKAMETKLREANAGLSHHSKKLSVLNNIITTANEAENPASLFRNVLDSILSLLDFEGGGIYIVDPDTRSASIVHSVNIPEPLFEIIKTVSVDEPPFCSLFLEGKPIISNNLEVFSPEVADITGFSSLISVPLVAKGRIVGALNAVSARRYDISEDEKEILLSAGAELGSTFERFAAEEKVKRNAKNLEVLFNSLGEMVFILDREGRIVTVNETVIRRLGYDKDELVGTAFILLHPGERRGEVPGNFGAMRAGAQDSFSVPVMAKDGSLIDVETKIARGWWHNREVFIGVARDITGRKEAEEALRRSEEEYRAIYDNSPIAIELYDRDGSLTHANSACLELFGVDDREVLSGFSLFEDPNISDERKKQLAEGKTLRYEVNFDFEKVRELNLYSTSRRGSIWLNVLITPLKTSENVISGYLVQIQDITDRELMAEELRRSEEKYRDLADNAPIGILTCDRAGRITYVNRKVPEMLGFPETGNTGGINLLQTRHLINAGFADVMNDVIGNGAEYPELELQNPLPDGKMVSLRIHISPIWRGDAPDGARLIIDDITRRKEAESLLERTKFAFDHSPDEIYFTNRDGLIVYANAHARSSFGIASDSPIQTTIFDINPGINPEEWEILWERLEGEEYFRFESVHRHPDGTTYPVDLIKYRISFEGGDYSCTIARDITVMKQTEVRLRKSEGRLRTLIQTIPDLIWLKDENGVFLACNSKFEELLGAKEDDIVGKTDYDFVNRELADFFRDNDRKAAKAGKPSVNEEWITFAVDGRRVLLETIKTPLYNPEGRVAGVLGIGRDITERKKAEEAVREVNRKINLLSSITRHDILNQITGAAGYLEMIELENEIPPGTKTEEYLRKITGAVETIERQITFTGYYKDLGEQAPDWFNVGSVIGNVERTPSFGTIRVHNAIEDIEVFADPLFEKVIYNLIDNAVKHGETITGISFYTKEKPGELIIICEDDGVGIPADAKEKIFRREYFKNSGLGLFLSREILSITGMTITETGTPGAGARFEIHVPEGMFRAASSKGEAGE
ncbi:PAS domain S-box protein [Methanogenium sp. S4BF]|uniref:PAS domain S-box protein n=1 Tax=Methanogenium sp. S4BF TaxID=1789226 RepID=UPI0024159F8C|nr:PAS domain S-box protein [Methanogenium sp. S4BF]WFN33484.1 PAS domain S-box protein [Methanogenium sp. S4BF]